MPDPFELGPRPAFLDPTREGVTPDPDRAGEVAGVLGDDEQRRQALQQRIDEATANVQEEALVEFRQRRRIQEAKQREGTGPVSRMRGGAEFEERAMQELGAVPLAFAQTASAGLARPLVGAQHYLGQVVRGEAGLSGEDRAEAFRQANEEFDAVLQAGRREPAEGERDRRFAVPEIATRILAGLSPVLAAREVLQAINVLPEEPLRITPTGVGEVAGMAALGAAGGALPMAEGALARGAQIGAEALGASAAGALGQTQAFEQPEGVAAQIGGEIAEELPLNLALIGAPAVAGRVLRGAGGLMPTPRQRDIDRLNRVMGDAGDIAPPIDPASAVQVAAQRVRQQERAGQLQEMGVGRGIAGHPQAAEEAVMAAQRQAAADIGDVARVGQQRLTEELPLRGTDPQLVRPAIPPPPGTAAVPDIPPAPRVPELEPTPPPVAPAAFPPPTAGRRGLEGSQTELAPPPPTGPPTARPVALGEVPRGRPPGQGTDVLSQPVPTLQQQLEDAQAMVRAQRGAPGVPVPPSPQARAWEQQVADVQAGRITPGVMQTPEPNIGGFEPPPGGWPPSGPRGFSSDPAIAVGAPRPPVRAPAPPAATLPPGIPPQAPVGPPGPPTGLTQQLEEAQAMIRARQGVSPEQWPGPVPPSPRAEAFETSMETGALPEVLTQAAERAGQGERLRTAQRAFGATREVLPGVSRQALASERRPWDVIQRAVGAAGRETGAAIRPSVMASAQALRNASRAATIGSGLAAGTEQPRGATPTGLDVYDATEIANEILTDPNLRRFMSDEEETQ